MVNPWFKFYGSEYLSDTKIASLSASERSCWITLLCLAGNSNEGGMIRYLTIEVLLEKSGIKFNPFETEDEWNNCFCVLSKLEKMKMIKLHDEGEVEILNWGKRQETTLTNSERQAKYRENKKSNEKVTGVTTKVTLEKKRIEERRREKKEEGGNRSILYLENIPEEDIQEIYKTYEISTQAIKDKAKAIVDYCKSRGKRYSDYKATLRVWISKDFKKRPEVKKVEPIEQVSRPIPEDIKKGIRELGIGMKKSLS